MTKRTILRKILRSPADGEGVDALVADVLSVPTQSEDALLSAVRKSGADDSVEVVAVAARRSLAALVKAYKDAGRPVPADVARALAGDSDDEDEEDGPPEGDFTTFDARRAIEEEDAENKGKKRKATRPDAGSEWSDDDVEKALGAYESTGRGLAGLSKEDVDGLTDAIRAVMPQWHADRVQKEKPGTPRWKAISDFYAKNPNHLTAQRSREAERVAKADAEHRERAASAERELRGLVACIRKADPGLSEPQAWVRALDERPDLYLPTPAPRYTAAEATIAKAKRDSANEKYEKLAEELRKSDSTLTREQAYTRAMDLHPEWYS